MPSGKYKGVKLFENGLIRVSIPNEEWPFNPLFGLLNSHGEEILPLKYKEISSFENNRAKICFVEEYDKYAKQQIGKWGVVDITGKILVDCKFDGIMLSGGTIKVSDNSGEMPLYGLLDDNGNELLPIKYSSISSFVNGRAVVRIGAHKVDEEIAYEREIIGGKWSVIDRNGSILIDEIAVPPGLIDDIRLMDNGFMIVIKRYKDYDKYGLLNEKGNIILQVQYSYISNFEDGLAKVCIGGKPDFFTGEATKVRWGIIDSTGRFIKECKYTWEEVNGET